MGKYHPLHVWHIPATPKGKKYWTVGIYPSLDELNRWLDSHACTDRWSERRGRGRPFLASVVMFEKPVTPNGLGYIVFSVERLGAGIVTHEMTHAALRTLGFGLGRRLGRAQEEELANTVEWLVTKFWQRWYRYAEPRGEKRPVRRGGQERQKRAA